MAHRRTATIEDQADRIVRQLGGKWQGDFAMCRCPAHADGTASLSVRVGERAGDTYGRHSLTTDLGRHLLVVRQGDPDGEDGKRDQLRVQLASVPRELSRSTVQIAPTSPAVLMAVASGTSTPRSPLK